MPGGGGGGGIPGPPLYEILWWHKQKYLGLIYESAKALF